MDLDSREGGPSQPLPGAAPLWERGPPARRDIQDPMLTFAYDIVCPYAYMAATRVQALSAERGVAVRWVPVLLGGLFRHHDAPQVPASAWPASKVALGAKDILRSADLLGVPLRPHPGHPQRTVEAMRLCVAAPDATRPALSLALYEAYWVEGRDLTDRSVLAEVAGRFGLDLAVLDDPAVKQALFDTTAEVAGRGAFGVPTFFVGDQMWWGVDRLGFVEAALGLDGADPGPGPASTVAAGQAVRFFHDFASPFSYLGATQVARVAARHGATVAWRPILLGALFRSIGTPNVPLMAFSPAKQRHLLVDLRRWAEHREVDFDWPACFPVRTVLPLRVALQAPEATAALYRALWVEGRNIGEPAVVAEVLTDLGLDAAGLIEGASDPAVKAQLFANTQLAETSGVCGVPTFQLEDGVVVWGQDRLALLDRLLTGWRPRPEAC